MRPYQSGDRVAVRRISHLVGYMGEPADWYWGHPESFADIWTGYYTDVEPESFFVAARDGDVVGYLAGCVDSGAAPTAAQALAWAVVRYALFARPGIAGFMWRGLADTIRSGGAPSGRLVDPRWPSHLHINLLAEARAAGAGASLIELWLERLARIGSPGCHLGTLLENERAIGFFERMGFRRFGAPQLTPGLRSPSGGRHHLQYMVRDL